MPYLSDSGGEAAQVKIFSPAMPIAIIGLSCRFPGEAATPASFWDSLLKQKSAYSTIPSDRWSVDSFHNPLKNRLNSSVTAGAHFLAQDIAAFDANFFNISQNEAQAIDPQQRMMLEVSYEAMENAGASMQSMAGTQTGCFIGAFTNDYREMMFRDPDAQPRYAASGAGAELLANRVSWFYDLRGPSVTMGTACSSGLVALHLACQSIRNGESKQAIVGGTNLLLDPAMFIGLSSQQFLAPDGLCKSFDASGNGYSRGEGIAALVLKPVDQAIRDGDNIRAVIRGTGINQDGKTKGITVPSADAQAELIRTTYASAGIDFKDTHYFEAHGTGTKAGDPVELEAISRTISQGRTERNKLIVGSVKSNIGHLESVAGLAGLIKAVYILETGTIPANIHFQTPNPGIPFDKWKITVPTKTTQWPAKGTRRISVNSFGYGGTNAHAVLEDAHHHLLGRRHNGVLTNGHRSSANGQVKKVAISLDHLNGNGHLDDDLEKLKSKVFVLSASDQPGLKRLKDSLAQYLRTKLAQDGVDGDEDSILRDLAFTLSKKRTRHPWKTYIVASSIEDLLEKLEDKSATPAPGRAVSDKPRIGFVFTGQGAQWARMGHELSQYKVFRDSIKAADQYLRHVQGCKWSAEEEFAKDDKSSRIDLPEFSQALCTVLQVATVDLLATWGISPVAVVGHSSGEIAAAYCLGAISKEDAWKVAYHRGVLSSQLKTLAPELNGAMMAVGASESQAREHIEQVTEGEIVVASVNSPSSVTISGDASGIHQLGEILTKKGVFNRKLKVTTAYHSPHMQAISSMYMVELSDMETKQATQGRRMHSSVSGDIVDAAELGAMNWVRNLVSPVLFTDSVSSLLQTDADGSFTKGPSVDIFIEVGPHPALKGPVSQVMQNLDIKGVEYRSVLYRGQSAIETALGLSGDLHILGVPVDVESINRSASTGVPKLLADLPPYPWNHSKTFWGESRLAQQFRFRKSPAIGLLGAPYPSLSESEAIWRGFLRTSEEAWIKDHQIQSSILYPAAGYLAMAIEAARQLADPNRNVVNYKLRDVIISSAVVLKEGDDIECVFQLRPHQVGTRDSSSTWWEFTISTCPAGTTDLRTNSSGLIQIEYKAAENSAANAEEKFETQAVRSQYHDIEKACIDRIDTTEFYKELAALGLVYGPAFRNVTKIANSVGKSLCDVVVPDTASVASLSQDGRPHVVHPATLDAIFHLSFAALKGSEGALKEAMVPTSIDEVIIAADAPFEQGAQFRGFCTAAKFGMKELKADIYMLDELVETPLVRVRGFTCAAFSGSSADTSDDEGLAEKGTCSKLIWKPSIELLSADEQLELIQRTVRGTMDEETVQHFKRAEYLALMFMHRIVDRVSFNNVAPQAHLQKLYGWLNEQQQLVKSETHPLQQLLGKSLETQIVTDLQSEFQAHDSNEQKLYLTATVLTQILLGHTKAEQFLFDENLLDRLLSNTPGTSQCAAKLAELVELILFLQPNASILELGGVSGGVAPKILSRRKGVFTNYTYSTPNEAVKQLAEKTLEPWKGSLKFVIDAHSASQTLSDPPPAYDIIIAANAFHESESVEEAVGQLRRLLKSGGRLCLIEATKPGVQLSCALGTLHSWWTRQTNNIASNEQSWRALLQKAGFEPVLPSPDFDDENVQQFSLMVAKAADAMPSSIAPGQSLTILEPRNPTKLSAALGARIALELDESGYRCKLQRWGDELKEDGGNEFIVLAEVECAMLPTLTKEDFNFMHQLISKASNVLWVTSDGDPTSAMASGLARSVRNESADLRFRTLQAMPKTLEVPDRLAAHIIKLTTYPTTDDEYIEEDGVLKVSRAFQDRPLNEELSAYLHGGKVELMQLGKAQGPQKLHIAAPGMLDSLQFESDELALTKLEAGEVEIEVKATGINFRDVMVAMGQIPDSLFGFEASGVITRVASDVTSLQPGQRVSCLGHGAHRTHFRSPAAFCQAIPDEITFEEAAGLPLVHATAYHALVNVMRVRKGQTILIHAAAGGVGQAAIQLAQHFEMEIFATVGSADKRALVQEEYGIPDDHIFHSRDTSFAKGVKRMTGGRGVDCILNSLAGEQLRQTWHCIAPFGTFVEIGLKDILGNTRLDMRPFIQDATFSFLNLQHVQKARPELMAEILKATFDLLRRRVTRPVFPVTAFPISDVENAFRVMQAGKHRGKLVLSFSGENMVKVHRNPSAELKLKSNGTYVLVGGFGGIGSSLAHLLVEHGARNIAFVSRSGASSREAKSLLTDLKKKDAVVKAYNCDIGDAADVQKTVQRCASEMPPVKGVFQCAMVLRDVLFENMDHRQWTESIRPKVQGTWNLHEHLPKEVDFFIILSSFAGVFGNRGQANYAAAGAYEDAFAHYRRSLGLKAVSIDLGIMREVGVLATGTANASRDLKDWEVPFGIRQIELHALIRKIIASEASSDNEIGAQVLTGFATGGGVANAGIRRPFYFDDPRFSLLELTGQRSQDGNANTEAAISLKAQLSAAKSVEAAHEAVTVCIVDKVARMMQTSVEEIDSGRPLHSFGVDSLVAVEIRNWLTKEAKADVTVFDILAAVPITALAEIVVSKSALVAKEEAGKGTG